MKQFLPPLLNLNKQSLLRYSVLFLLFIFSVAIQAQVPTHHLIEVNANSTNAAAGTSGIGEVVWVLITLIFSYALNFFIRKGEKRPEKAPDKEHIPVIEQMESAVQAEKPDLHGSILISNNNYKTSKGYYKRKHILQPLGALHLITGVHNKQRVAS